MDRRLPAREEMAQRIRRAGHSHSKPKTFSIGKIIVALVGTAEIMEELEAEAPG